MQIVKNLKKVGTTTLELPGYSLDIPVFGDGKGKSLEDFLEGFQADTWKLLIDQDGMVRGYTKEPSSFSLFEGDGETNTLVEISEEDLPEGFFDQRNFTMWSWTKKGGVSKRTLPDDENEQMNMAIKKDTIGKINDLLSPLQLAEKYGEQSEDEAARQTDLEKKLISVGRINPKDRDILWPTIE